jgi:hypothetical protein
MARSGLLHAGANGIKSSSRFKALVDNLITKPSLRI